MNSPLGYNPGHAPSDSRRRLRRPRQRVLRSDPRTRPARPRRGVGQGARGGRLPQRLALGHRGDPSPDPVCGRTRGRGPRRSARCGRRGSGGRRRSRPQLGSLLWEVLRLPARSNEPVPRLCRPDLGGHDDGRDHSAPSGRRAGLSLQCARVLCRIRRGAFDVLRAAARRPCAHRRIHRLRRHYGRRGRPEHCPGRGRRERCRVRSGRRWSQRSAGRPVGGRVAHRGRGSSEQTGLCPRTRGRRVRRGRAERRRGRAERDPRARCRSGRRVRRRTVGSRAGVPCRPPRRARRAGGPRASGLLDQSARSAHRSPREGDPRLLLRHVPTRPKTSRSWPTCGAADACHWIRSSAPPTRWKRSTTRTPRCSRAPACGAPSCSRTSLSRSSRAACTGWTPSRGCVPCPSFGFAPGRPRRRKTLPPRCRARTDSHAR